MSTGASSGADGVGSGPAAMEYERLRQAVLLGAAVAVRGAAWMTEVAWVGGLASTIPTRPMTLSETTALEAVGGVTMAGADGAVA